MRKKADLHRWLQKVKGSMVQKGCTKREKTGRASNRRMTTRLRDIGCGKRRRTRGSTRKPSEGKQNNLKAPGGAQGARTGKMRKGNLRRIHSRRPRKSPEKNQRGSKSKIVGREDLVWEEKTGREKVITRGPK